MTSILLQINFIIIHLFFLFKRPVKYQVFQKQFKFEDTKLNCSIFVANDYASLSILLCIEKILPPHVKQ